MAEKSVRSIELYDQDVAFLEEMAAKYSLSDIGKAVRCLVAHAQENRSLELQIFDEIRCQHC